MVRLGEVISFPSLLWVICLQYMVTKYSFPPFTSSFDFGRWSPQKKMDKVQSSTHYSLHFACSFLAKNHFSRGCLNGTHVERQTRPCLDLQQSKKEGRALKLPPLFVEHCAFGPSVAALATPTNHINTGHQAILQESRREIIWIKPTSAENFLI